MNVLRVAVLVSLNLGFAFSKECQDIKSLVQPDFDINQVNGTYYWDAAPNTFPFPTDPEVLKKVLPCVIMDARISNPNKDNSVILGLLYSAPFCALPTVNQPHCAEMFSGSLRYNSPTGTDGKNEKWTSVADLSSGDPSEIFKTLTSRVVYFDGDFLVMSYCVLREDGTNQRPYIHVFRQTESTKTLDQLKASRPDVATIIQNTVPVCNK